MSQRFPVYLLAAVVGLLLVSTLVSDRQSPVDTVSSARVVGTCPDVIEHLDSAGAVIETFDCEEVCYGPAGIVAFVTTDGRRLFLERGQWRVR